MNNNSIATRIVNALSYFSIFFLPVIFPLIVWIIARASDGNQQRPEGLLEPDFPAALLDFWRARR